MSFHVTVRQLIRASVAAPRAVAKRQPRSTIRQYSSSGVKPSRKPAFDNNNDNGRIWAMVLGASAVIGTAVYSIAPTPTQTSRPPSALQSRHKSENFESTKDRGLQPNVEPKWEQDARQTTGANTQRGNAVESVPDAKGFRKKRISSENGMKQGTADKAPTRGYEGVEDKVAASKPHGGQGSISGKQEGLSNTDTKYSIDLTNTSDQSQKGEGTPETSKSKGTVDTRRPLTH